jgi:hypothetical protein
MRSAVLDAVESTDRMKTKPCATTCFTYRRGSAQTVAPIDLTKDDTYSVREDDVFARSANKSGFFVGHPPMRTPTRYNAYSVSQMPVLPP